MRAALALILALIAAPAGAVCTQTGYLQQAEILPTGVATFYLAPNPSVRIAYAYTTDNERLIGVLSEKIQGIGGVKVTLIGDAAICPAIGPTRPAGVITRVIAGE
jgi:hypothetical protein